MKVEARIFEIITIFFFLAAILYGGWTYLATHAVEPVGFVGITLTGGLSLIVGTYFRFVARRVETRPEDDDEAEVADGAGELGFFSPGSYWPVGLAAAAALTGVSLAFFQIWMIVISGAIVLVMVGGLVFEYHLPPKHE